MCDNEGGTGQVVSPGGAEHWEPRLAWASVSYLRTAFNSPSQGVSVDCPGSLWFLECDSMSDVPSALEAPDDAIRRLEAEVSALRSQLEEQRSRMEQQRSEFQREKYILEAVIRQCPVPMVVVSVPDGVFQLTNLAAVEILGIAQDPPYTGSTLAEVLTHRSWSELHSDGSPVPNSDSPLSRAMRGEATTEQETVVVRHDGTRRWRSVSATPIFDEGGNQIACVAVFPDVTRRKLAEAELRALHERLDLALEGGDVGIWDWNVATGEVSYDARWTRMLGYAPGQLGPTQMTWEALLHPEDVGRAREATAGVLRGDTDAFELEYRLKHSDGSWAWVLSKGRVSGRDADGRALRIVGTHANITRRKQDELARLEAERISHGHALEMAWLMQSMANAFVVWGTELDAEGQLKELHFAYFNEAYERVAHVTLAEVKGKSVREVWPETEQSWYEVLGEVARTGVSRRFEMFHAPTHGLYACAAYRPPHVQDRICVVFEDISEQRANFEALQSLAGEQRAILNAVSVGITLVKDRRFQWLNPELARMFGYSVDELLGAPTSTIYMDLRDHDHIGVDGYAQIALGAVYSDEIQFKKRDDSALWCHLTGQLVDPQDPSKGSIWVLNDTNERRHAEAALRESEQRFKRLVQHSSDVIIITDRDGTIRSASDSALRVLGYDPAELVDTVSFELVHPGDLKALNKVLAAVLQSPGVPIRVEYRHRHRDGRWIPVESVGTNLLEDPAVQGVVHNLRDTSERSQLAEQLQQAMKMEAVGRLAGGVAHDFNNLLTAISGNVELARADLSPQSPVAQLLQDAASAAASAASLTRQLLAFSRRQMIEPRVLNLNEVVDGVRKMLGRIIGEDISLTTSLAPDLGAVRVDPGQFEQVLVNLAVNARDAMPGGGSLVLETGNVELDAEYVRLHPTVIQGRYVQLAVSDTGAGMDDHVKQRLFEPFFTTKPKGRGTGLGLATIFGIVKQAGGSIEVYSEVGKGSTFRIYLPRVDAVPGRFTRSVTPEAAPEGCETVLLVEDDAGVRNLTQVMLRRLGYAVKVAENGQRALELAASCSETIHLLITDVIMPGMNGRELSTRLTSTRPELRVLFTSGYTDNVIVHHGVVDEHAHFISKPYSLQGLGAKIREVLENSSPFQS